MELDNFSHSNDNLYKYIIITGLSLLLIPQLNNTNLINNILKQVEFEQEQQKKINEQELFIKSIEEIGREVEATIETIFTTTKIYISEMNLYLPNGKQVETIEEFDIFIIEFDKVVSDFKNAFENKANIQEVERLKNNIHFLFGTTGDTNDFLNYLSEEKKRLDEMIKFLDESREELRPLVEKILEVKIEQNKLSQDYKDMSYELKKIELEGKFYKQEKTINDLLRIIGGVMTVAGVFLWYFKIQRYHDDMYKKSNRKMIKKYYNRKKSGKGF